MTSAINKIKSTVWAQLFLIYTRYLIGSAFVFASIVKIKGERFSRPGMDDPMGTPFHLFETLYQTGLWWQFIGWGQFLAGAFLLTQRYALLGAVMNFPIVLNVFFITISLDFSGTPMITSGMLLANLVLLMWHWPQLKVLVNLKPGAIKVTSIETHKVWEVTGIAMLLITILARLWPIFNELMWVLTMFCTGILALIFFYYKTLKPLK